jgi:hypothetical protein
MMPRCLSQRYQIVDDVNTVVVVNGGDNPGALGIVAIVEENRCMFMSLRSCFEMLEIDL